MRQWIGCLVLFLGLLTTNTSMACSLAGNVEFVTDDTLPAMALSEFEVTVEGIKRGNDSGSSCDDLGWLDLRVTNPDTEVGYKLEVIDGDPPKNFGVPQSPVSPMDSTMTFAWTEEPAEDQPAVNFTLRLTAVAPNGDLGPFEDVVVSDPGRDGGCSTTGEGDISVVSLFMFALVVMGLRRIQ